MPPHHRGPLSALSPFRTSITPFTAQRCLLAPPVPSHSLCEEDLNQWKPKQCTMDPPLPPMIQLWRERNMGEEGDEREKGGRWRGGWTCRHLVCGKRGGGKRCGVHANHVPLFSAKGVQDSLTKAQQMDQAGSPSPQKKCAVMKTTFFHTKPLCSHGYAWLNVWRRPFATQSHPVARTLGLLSCLDHSALSLCLYPSFYSESIFVSKRIFAYLPPYSHIFVADFREMRSPRQVIHIDGQCSALIGCQRLLSFCFPQNLTLFWFL